MSNFRKEIEQAINKYSAENNSNTPDFILAEFVMDSLAAFDKATNARVDWHKIENIEKLPNPNIQIVGMGQSYSEYKKVINDGEWSTPINLKELNKAVEDTNRDIVIKVDKDTMEEFDKDMKSGVEGLVVRNSMKGFNVPEDIKD